MRKYTEESILAYFSKNRLIELNKRYKYIMLDESLYRKTSIIRRLAYLVNECDWSYCFTSNNISE